MAIIKPRVPRLQRGHPLARGLLTYLPMCEGSGPALADAAGRNPGTLSATGVTWSASPCGPALDFDGGTSSVVTGTSLMGGLTDATWAVRVYQRSTGGSGFGAWLNSNTGYTGGFFVGVNNGDSAQAYIGNAQVVTAAGTFFRDRWHDVAVVFRGSTSLGIYIDGRLSNTSTTSIETNVLAHTGYRLGNDTSESLPASCKIDRVAFYNRALSAGELARIAADPFALVRPARSPIAYFAAVAGAGGVGPTYSLGGYHHHMTRSVN
jgi:hypothetical protein